MVGIICEALGRGVKRSKRQSMRWIRKAAENGHDLACFQLAMSMYEDHPYAREVGRVGEAAGAATSAGVMEGHDVPSDALIDVVHWLERGKHNALDALDELRTVALEGHNYCCNDGCKVVGHLKEFKVCPQCKTARYCGEACQKQAWNAGGHKETCDKNNPRH